MPQERRGLPSPWHCGTPAVPIIVGTVFAGADVEATERARDLFAPYPPSSPSVAILRDGQLVFMLERREIETRDALGIAAKLTAAFDQHCG